MGGEIVARNFLIEFFGEKWDERREDLAEANQDEINSSVGVGFVGEVVVFRDATAVATNVPVAEVFDEGQNTRKGFGDIVGFHARGKIRLQLGEASENPEVERIFGAEVGRWSGFSGVGEFLEVFWINTVNGGVGGKEVENVPNHGQFAVDVGDIFVG